MTIGISVFGSGRIGVIHARNAAKAAGARLVSIMNPDHALAQPLADELGVPVVESAEQALSDPAVDAVIICTPTSTHVELIEQAARAGRAVMCEKPLDLAIDRVDRAMAVLEETGTPFMLSFNRRFDPGVAALRAAVEAGEVGALNMLSLTSRDPAPPPIDYVRQSGGYFADSTIHDIDLACWITGELPVEVHAAGSCLVDPAIGAEGDCDTAMTTLKMPSGVLVHINNSRRAVYGFDQRIEAFGSGGMVQTANQHNDNLLRTTAEGFARQSPLKHFFLERYEASFAHALDEFVSALRERRAPSATQRDGRNALVIARACEESRTTGRVVRPQF